MNRGNKIWIIPGGHIPLLSKGPEPEFTSRDKMSMLNTNTSPAQVKLTIYYEDREPAGPYKIELKELSVRYIRFNDLVDPLPLPLDTHFAVLIKSDQPIVVQFTRMNTSHAQLALCTTMAFPGDT